MSGKKPVRRHEVRKPKRMKRSARRGEPKAITLAPLPRPVERHEPVKTFSRIWP